MRKLIFMLFLLMGVALYAISVIDDLGRYIEIDNPPERVIIAAPGVTGFFTYLGLENKIVGVTDWDSFALSHEVEKIGNLIPLNIEKIISLNPDIVFLTGGFQESEIPKLEQFNIKAVVINPNTFEEVFRDISLIAAIFSEEKRGSELANEFRKKILEIAKKTFSIPLDKKPRVFYAMITGDVKEIWTCGTGSFLNQAITYAGGVNVAAPYTGNNGWFPVSPEFVLDTQPEIILVPFYYDGGDVEVVNKIMEYAPFKELPAIKDGRVYAVDGNLFAYANPDFIKIIENLYSIFYGE
ncbi:iron ABC transporter substrate-binding protein [Kosmotoga arenicorallina S304]|uniref:Iron ABC transporter substrate-binding protein n=1 Tax=Kosmotoga arenicorallina S304 TaxID=1453497 RepID=A0A182C743_9BACT|nr:ABC transporter substrate-binding protein [Kosmotoga arenicorallina]OAA31260.1 iron ABC transporter substrate-binding protein [Kosmotoga arenicorallina S304]